MNSLEEFGRRLNYLFANEDKTYQSLLKEFFSRSANVYSDVLSLLNELSSNHLKLSGIKSSLSYVIVQQLDDYVKKSPNDSQLIGTHLTPSVRWSALQFALRKKNQTWMDIIADVYHLNSIQEEKILDAINKCLEEKKFLEASLLVIKFRFADHFDIKQILIPLLFQVWTQTVVTIIV